ncbi:MAG: DoxX family protein [Stenotrophobium sp.]
MRGFIIAQSRALLGVTVTLDWFAPLLVRLVFGYFWLETGLGKLQNIDTFTGRFMNWGVPFPAFSATLSGCTDLIGGGLLMLGLFTRLATIPMIVNMIVAISLVQINNVHGLDDFVELDEVVYALMLFWLTMAGPGRVSLDHLLRRAFFRNAPYAAASSNPA